MQRLHLPHALLPTGFTDDVLVTLEGGTITAVEPGADPAGAERVAGITVPGVLGLHSHAFQRGMAGLAERRGPAGDSFWTWRELMYRFLGRLTPEDVEAVAALAYLEMLEGGFTAVGEFHYLHHGPDGAPYADPAEMAGRVAVAARGTGIALTLLPCFYGQGGFGGVPPTHGQRRFVNTPESFATLLDASRRHLADLPNAALGLAPHSLRAVTPKTLAAIVALAPDGPIHIHAAEQVREVEECLASSGARPIRWLLDNAGVDERWCVVHATHMHPDETEGLARSGAIAGLCPLTEASLGDGTFDGPRFLAAGGAFGIGTDSNVQIDAAAELRQLEYSQRLAHRGRNLMTSAEGESTGWRLYTSALAGGAQALTQPTGAIAPGCRADLVTLDADHPSFAGARPESWLDVWIFAAGREAVREVRVGGERLVADGRHRARDRVAARYRDTLRRLRDEI